MVCILEIPLITFLIEVFFWKSFTLSFTIIGSCRCLFEWVGRLYVPERCSPHRESVMFVTKASCIVFHCDDFPSGHSALGTVLHLASHTLGFYLVDDFTPQHAFRLGFSFPLFKHYKLFLDLWMNIINIKFKLRENLHLATPLTVQISCFGHFTCHNLVPHTFMTLKQYTYFHEGIIISYLLSITISTKNVYVY